MNRANLFRTLAIAGLAVLSAVPQNAAEIRRLTLTEAVHLAITQNRALLSARDAVHMLYSGWIPGRYGAQHLGRSPFVEELEERLLAAEAED